MSFTPHLKIDIQWKQRRHIWYAVNLCQCQCQHMHDNSIVLLSPAVVAYHVVGWHVWHRNLKWDWCGCFINCPLISVKRGNFSYSSWSVQCDTAAVIRHKREVRPARASIPRNCGYLCCEPQCWVRLTRLVMNCWDGMESEPLYMFCNGWQTLMRIQSSDEPTMWKREEFRELSHNSLLVSLS